MFAPKKYVKIGVFSTCINTSRTFEKTMHLILHSLGPKCVILSDSFKHCVR